MSSIDSTSIVLASNGFSAVSIPRLNPGLADGTEFVEIAKSNEKKIGAQVYIPSTLETGEMRMVQFMPSDLATRITTFWASLYGSNIKSSDSMVMNLVPDLKLPICLTAVECTSYMTIARSESYFTPTLPEFTCITYISNSQLALGQCNGTVLILPISALLIPVSPITLTSSHSDPITILHVPENKESTKKRLLGGSLFGCVTLWETENNTTLATFYTHSKRIISFIPCPLNPKKKVISIGSDSSVCQIQIEEMKTMTFIGHETGIKSIHWRGDDIMMILSGIDTMHVWQLKTGHLDRIVHGSKAVDDLLEGCEFSIM